MEGMVELRRPEPGTVVVGLQGEHDLATAAGVERVLSERVQAGDRVVLDLSTVEFVDSSILDVAARTDAALRRRDARLVLLVGTAPVVEAALALSGLLRAIPWAETEDDATGLARHLSGTG